MDVEWDIEDPGINNRYPLLSLSPGFIQEFQEEEEER